MKQSSRRAAALFLAGSSTLFWLGCASNQKSAPSETAAPRAAPLAAGSAMTPADDEASAAPAAKAADAAPAGAAAPARESAPSGALAPKKKDAALRDEEAADSKTELDQLSLEARYFDESLSPTALSCAGAKPHRDAICAIAERLCELSTTGPSTTGPGARCVEAKQSCESARSRFKARCGE
jgi:hypothetical protein